MVSFVNWKISTGFYAEPGLHGKSISIEKHGACWVKHGNVIKLAKVMLERKIKY